jgi:hypothetical protein
MDGEAAFENGAELLRPHHYTEATFRLRVQVGHRFPYHTGWMRLRFAA